MKKILLFSTVLLFLISCEKSLNENYVINDDFVKQKSNVRTSNQTTNDLREEFVRILAIAMQDKNLRIFIKEKALQKYSGDYDFPYALVKDDIVKEKETFAEILTRYADDLHKKKFGKVFFTQDILESDPYLSILLPVLSGMNPESWSII